jgi:hypothetical protein
MHAWGEPRVRDEVRDLEADGVLAAEEEEGLAGVKREDPTRQGLLSGLLPEAREQCPESGGSHMYVCACLKRVDGVSRRASSPGKLALNPRVRG